MREPLIEFRPRAGRVGLDLLEGSPAGLRMRRGSHVSLHFANARAASLEAPEIEVAVPADLFLDDATSDFHITSEGDMVPEDLKLSQY